MKKGFTLVELAIVLVIIGVILSGALKGAELIKDARAKNNLALLTKLADAQFQFYERYGRYAGDENNDAVIDFQTLNSNTYPDETNITTPADMDYAFAELETADLLPTLTNREHAQLTEGGPAYFAGTLLDETVGDVDIETPVNMVVIRQVPCLTAFAMELRFDNNQPDTAGSAADGRVRYINGASLESARGWTDSTLCADDEERTTNIAYLLN